MNTFNERSKELIEPPAAFHTHHELIMGRIQFYTLTHVSRQTV